MFIFGECICLVQFLENVVDNVVKFFDDVSEVIVFFLVYCECLWVLICDFGCGVLMVVCGMIFDKFMQVDMGDM